MKKYVASHDSDRELLQPAQALHVDELIPDAPLADRVEQVLQNRKAIAMANLFYLQAKNKLSQNKMCAELFEGLIQAPTISNYRNDPSKDMTWRNIITIALAFGYDPEVFMTQLLAELEGENAPSEGEKVLFDTLEGTYTVAFYATGIQPGSASRPAKKSVATSVVTFFVDAQAGDTTRMSVLALIDCSKAEYREFTEKLSKVEDGVKGIHRLYREKAALHTGGNRCFYKGHLEIIHQGSHIADVVLDQQGGGNDRIHFLFRVPDPSLSSNAKYTGGLAVMTSLGRSGEQIMPCMQAAIFSRKKFSVPNDELVDALHLTTPPRLDLKNEAAAIATYMKMLYAEKSDSPLAGMRDGDKDYMLTSFIERILNDALRHSQLTGFDISAEMDAACGLLSTKK